MPRSLLWIPGALLLLGAPALAQEADPVAALDLPDEVADAVIEYFNDPAHLRYTGPTTIAAGDTVRGDVAALEGPLVLGGHVEGNLVMVNGDLRLLPGASVSGDLWVIGGAIEGEHTARIAGELVVYPERLAYRTRGGRMERVGRAEEDAVDRWGRSDFLVATGKSYNRVEGMPITFGPRIQLAGSNPLRIHALAIYRTESGMRIDTQDMGYYVWAEQFLGGRRALRVGATAHSLVDPVEDWHLTDLESGLSTFLFHRDFRDHFERDGVSAFGTWQRRGSPLGLTGELRWDRHRSVPARSPWSLFHNAEPWRPQPLVGEGRVTSALGIVSYDTRNDPGAPSTGWYVRGRLEQALTSGLVRPAGFVEVAPASRAIPEEIAAQEFGRFATGRLDIRRYNRIDPESRLNFRLLLAGSLTGGELPPQYQHALGGEGSLPGYDLFSRDCGARARPVFRSALDAADPTAPAFFPRYGCDAVGLFQAEFRGKLSFRLRWDSAPWRDDSDEEEEEWGVGWDFSPDWTVFVDAGRGWAADGGTDEALAVDAGVGVVVSRLGFYLALPLTGTGGVNAFIRIGPRF